MTEPDHEGLRLLFVPLLQTIVLLACITCVTVLGDAKVIDAPAITAIIGAIVGSIVSVMLDSVLRLEGGASPTFRQRKCSVRAKQPA